MRRTTKLAGMLAAMLSLAAVLAGGAMAAPTTLHLKYGTLEVAPGQDIEGYDTSWSLESSEGSATCAYSEKNEGFLGKDETNNAKTDQISVESVFGTFATDSACSSSITGFSPEARGFWFNANSNSYSVTGKFKLTTKGTGEYATSAKGATDVALENNSAPEFYCFYEVKKLKGTLGSLPGDVYIGFSKQKVKLLKEATTSKLKSASTCPKLATVSTTVFFYVPLSEGSEHVVEGEVK